MSFWLGYNVDMKSDKIVWSQASIEELKALLLEEEAEELDDSEEQISLDYPWEVVVVRQQTVTDENGGTSVNAVLKFDEVDGAEDYEVRVSLIDDDAAVAIGPISEWNFNSTDGTLTGVNSAIFTQSVSDKKTTTTFPILARPDWEGITLYLTVNRPVVDADGFAVAIVDPNFYAQNYAGLGGAYVGFFNSGSASGLSMDTTEGHYCAYDESMYVPTGNEGPTIRYNDGTTKTRINTLAPGDWAGSVVGSHDYTITWDRVGVNSANMRVFMDGNPVISKIGAWVPQEVMLIISAATGAHYNVHEISNVGGFIEY